MLKNLLYKIRLDLSSVNKYPEFTLDDHGLVDYGAYWQKRSRGDKPKLSAWQRQRAEHLSKMIRSGSRVLDIGCGDGAVLQYLKERINIEELGIDVDMNILEVAKKIGVNVRQVDLRNLEELNDLSQFDYVIGLEIIEHLPNPEELIFILKNKCRRAMIFSFPNTGYYSHRLRLLLGRFPLQWINHPGEHLRFWTVKDVKWWVMSLDLRLEEMILYEGIRGLNKILPSLFGQGIIIKISTK